MEQTPQSRSRRIRAIRSIVAGGARRFEPSLHAVRLLNEGGDDVLGPKSREALKAQLRLALRAERRRARTGHWSYDLNRHLGLLQALKALSHCEGRLRRRPSSPDGRV